jgi:hypothetical protein
MVEDVTYYTPFYVVESVSFDRIAIRTNSTFTNSSVVRLGVYDNANGQPTTVEFDAGTVSCSAASTLYTITISKTLAAGWYWLACNRQSGTGTTSFTGSLTNLGFGMGRFPTNGNISSLDNCWSESGVTGAFATAGSVGSIVGTNTAPIVVLRKT